MRTSKVSLVLQFHKAKKIALFPISRPCQFFCACQKFLQGSQQQVKSFSICLP
jgi:hypothetical protein